MSQREDMVATKKISLHLGPQHPSAHGLLHLVIDMQGEKVLKVHPEIGYLHRGTEKIAENLLYHQFVRKDGLIRAMFTGSAPGKHGQAAPVAAWKALLIALVLAGLLWWGLEQAPQPQPMWW